MIFVVMVLLAAVVLIVGINAILLVPIVVIALMSLLWAPIIAAMAGGERASGPGPAGVPSTGDASYDPQMRPEDRPTA